MRAIVLVLAAQAGNWEGTGETLGLQMRGAPEDAHLQPARLHPGVAGETSDSCVARRLRGVARWTPCQGALRTSSSDLPDFSHVLLRLSGSVAHEDLTRERDDEVSH